MTQKFAVAAGAIMILTAVFLVNIHQLTTTAQTERIASETNGYVLQALSNGLLDEVMPLLDLAETDNEIAPTYPSYQHLDAAVRRYLAGTPILKLKIYGTDGLVAYSTDPMEVGQDYSKNDRFIAAFGGSNVVRELFREEFRAWSGPRKDLWLLAGYLPIRSGYDQGPVIGVIKIYRDITALHKAIKAASVETGIVIAAAFALLFVLLLTIVWNAEKKARADHDANLALARAKANAEAAAREKTQFITSISHELRTPLNAIIGFAEILEKEIAGPLGHATYKEYVQDIGKSGQHLLGIINEVLDLVKVESGSLAIHRQVIDVPAIANGVARMLAPVAEQYENRIVVEAINDLSPLETDAAKLRQILVNIATNGLKFTPKGGTVRIRLEQDPATGSAVIRVIDNGIGIRPEDIALAEAPFGQIENALTRSREGTGLGLTLSRRFTEALGGTFTIESMPDVGTAVTITLPGMPPKPKEDPSPADVRESGTKAERSSRTEAA
ncbi:MAG: HAMP domain-containing histidine kinase [Alphaproteobacteria bacterium]|nr:HAMP domain-containing histidine kinase [Alphaproteobacteria bacterium]